MQANRDGKMRFTKGLGRICLVVLCGLVQLHTSTILAQNKAEKSQEPKKTRTIEAIDEDAIEGLSMLSREVSGIARQTRREYASSGALTIDDVLRQTGKKSPDKILGWVREHIAFEPYEGALRSPGMVLSMRRANAADAARLLVALLEAAGKKPTYAWGDLPDKEASVMLLKFGELVQFELRGKARELDQPVSAELVRRVRARASTRTRARNRRRPV